MRKLKTPEDTLNEFGTPSLSFFIREDLKRMITAAQRDSLECFKIHIKDNTLENGYVSKKGLNRVIENLIPKEK